MPRSRAAAQHAFPLAEEEELEIGAGTASPPRARSPPAAERPDRGARGPAPSPSRTGRRSRALSAAKSDQSASQAPLGRARRTPRTPRARARRRCDREVVQGRARRIRSFQRHHGSKSTRAPPRSAGTSRRSPSGEQPVLRRAAPARSAADCRRTPKRRVYGEPPAAGRPERQDLPERLPRRPPPSRGTAPPRARGRRCRSGPGRDVG